MEHRIGMSARVASAGCLALALAGAAFAVAAQPGRSPTPVVRAAHTDARCPVALVPAGTAASDADRAVRTRLAKLYPGAGGKGARVYAVEALGRNPGAPGLDPARYAAAARKACDERTAGRSWAVFVTFPQAHFADSAVVAVFAARTRAGWRPWFEYSPATRSGRFLRD